MHITCDTPRLRTAVTWAAQSLPTRPPTPALAGIRLHAQAAALTVEATNLDAASTATVPVEGTTPGQVILPGKLLHDIVRALTGSSVTLRVDADGAHLVCGRATYRLPVLPPDGYPVVPVGPQPLVNLPTTGLATAVRRVAKAANNATVPVLGGIQTSIEPGSGLVTFVATDRYRLAVATLIGQPRDPADTPVNVVIPGRDLDQACRSLLPGNGLVQVGAAESGWSLRAEGFTLTGRALAGDYPAWQRLLPAGDGCINVNLPVAALTETLTRIAVVADTAGTVRLRLQPGVLTVSAAGADPADANGVETVDITYDGPAFTIAFNHQYLRDGLAGSGELSLRADSPTRPILLSNPDGDYRYLLMPVRTNDA